MRLNQRIIKKPQNLIKKNHEGKNMSVIENIIDICKAYDVKCPHEFRLTYNVISKSFDSNYNYDNVTEALDKDVLELVEDWFNECNKSISEQEKEIVFYNETKKKNEDARVFVITNFFKYVTD